MAKTTALMKITPLNNKVLQKAIDENMDIGSITNLGKVILKREVKDRIEECNKAKAVERKKHSEAEAAVIKLLTGLEKSKLPSAVKTVEAAEIKLLALYKKSANVKDDDDDDEESDSTRPKPSTDCSIHWTHTKGKDDYRAKGSASIGSSYSFNGNEEEQIVNRLKTLSLSYRHNFFNKQVYSAVVVLNKTEIKSLVNGIKLVLAIEGNISALEQYGNEMRRARDIELNDFMEDMEAELYARQLSSMKDGDKIVKLIYEEAGKFLSGSKFKLPALTNK